jgi:hypothetical protein
MKVPQMAPSTLAQLSDYWSIQASEDKKKLDDRPWHCYMMTSENFWIFSMAGMMCLA